MNNTETGEASDFLQLETIPILKARSQWDSWIQRITNYLKMRGYGDLLHRNKDKPELEPLASAKDFKNRLREWKHRQGIACALVENRLGDGASRLIENDPENVSNRLDKLRLRYKPRDGEVFRELSRRFSSLTLAQCSGVREYGEALRTARDQMQNYDRTCTIGDPVLIERFLHGLGPEYNTFLIFFDEKHRVFPKRDSTDPDIIIEPAITFDELVNLLQLEQQRISYFSDQMEPLPSRVNKRQRS